MDINEFRRLYQSSPRTFKILFSGSMLTFALAANYALDRYDDVLKPAKAPILTPIDLEWQKEQLPEDI